LSIRSRHLRAVGDVPWAVPLHNRGELVPHDTSLSRACTDAAAYVLPIVLCETPIRKL
jgi:hypothetical protein